MATTDKAEWILLDTDLTTRLSIMPVGDNSHLYFEINEPGSGELKVPADSIVAGLITTGMFCECFYRGSSRGGFFVDNIKKSEVEGGEDGARWMSLSGRGPLALLDDAIVWDDGSGVTTREFTTVTKASIFKTLIDEAQARGALANLTYDFTAVVDSNTVAWTDSESYKLPVGTSLLDVARQFTETGGFDFEINLVAGNFVLSAYSAGIGTDKSATIYMRSGRNCEEVSLDERGNELRNATRVKYHSGYVTVSDGASITANRRRESLLSLEQAQTTSSAITYASAKLSNTKDPRRSIAMRVYDGVKPYLFIDYDMGDYIELDIKGTESRYRILGLQLDFDGTDFAHVVLELNTLLYDSQLEMQEDLDWLLDQWVTAKDAGQIEVAYWQGYNGSPSPMIAIFVDGNDVYVAGEGFIGGTVTEGTAKFNIATGLFSAFGTVTAFDYMGAMSICKYGSDIIFGGKRTNTSAQISILTTSTETELARIIDFDGVADVRVNCFNTETSYLYAGSAHGLKIDPLGIIPDIPLYNHVSRWDGATWTSVGSIASQDANRIGCNTLIHFNGDLYGGFEVGGSLNGFMVVSGGEWVAAPITSPTTAGVQALAVVGDLLVIASGTTIATWDGVASDWTVIGTLGSGEVNQIIVNLTDLYMVGNFVSVDAVTVNNGVKYSGGAWSALTTGLNAAGQGAIYYQDDLYVVGNFTTAGDQTALSMASYTTSFESLIDHLRDASQSFDMAAAIHGAPASAITDADEMGFWEDVSAALRKITWANIKSTLATYFSTLYLKLDGSNDPVTGQVEIINATNGAGALYLQTIGDAYSLDVEQYTVGDNVTSPTQFLYRESRGAGNITAPLIDGRSADSGAGSVSGDWINFQHEGAEKFKVDFAGSVNIPTGQTYDVNGVAHTHAGGSGHTIQDEGTSLTARTNLNFVGAGVVVVDDAGNDQTDVAIPGGYTQEEIEDFVGAMVSGNTETGIAVTYDDTNGKLDFAVSATAETNANDIFRCDSPGGASAFAGTIATLPGGAVLTYSVTSGQEGAMVPTSTSQLAKMRLYNTTRGTSALISNCVTGTNTITLTANVPAGWATTDVITIASQTVSGGGLGWVDIEITSALTGKTSIFCNMQIISATAGDAFRVHPFTTFATSAISPLVEQAANIQADKTPLLKIISNVLSISWAGTPTTIYLREAGYLQ